MEEWLNFIRGLVRPILTFAIIGILAGLVFVFAGKFMDTEIARALLFFFTGAGTVVLGYWFGERKASK
ncbi:unnamed protein product [marine sediment metagenome]|uniref:Uncharacterized protein n=1 Tax=marine sediment metagenome TaxID=412755 RepID=X1UQI0_9ZZZZ